jgi:hypothetical protein
MSATDITPLLAQLNLGTATDNSFEAPLLSHVTAEPRLLGPLTEHLASQVSAKKFSYLPYY